ncbi:MAG: RidA family protein [Deltaproteobacteria bacterium]|nr:RidA family protein [Deltaproteobacteria bacterium]MDZ4342055.1 RidA family protein [Candidatus Binatia bacterium]
MRTRFFELDGQAFVIASANGSGGNGPAEQAELTMARLRQDLDKVGSRFENILRIVVYMKNREIWDTVGNVRQKVFVPWETRPASASIFVGAFRHVDALVEIEATAMLRSEIISKRGVEYEPARAYLRALVSGPFVFLSGTGGQGATEEAQAQSSFASLGACLESQGGSLRDIRRVTIFLKRLEAMGDVSRVFHRLFKEPRPYTEYIPATGFARDEMLVEIQGTVVVK